MSKFLNVDDSPAELADLCSILDRNGFDALTASTGAEAVRKAAAEHPQMIFMDLVMPDMDGYEACRQLKSNLDTRGIPVVFMSTRHQKADQMWARMQGGNGLIAKPCAAQQVMEALRTYAGY